MQRPTVPPANAAPFVALCGSERWTVKTFADGDRWQVDLTAASAQIAQLNTVVKPSPLPQNGRMVAELRAYRITGTVTRTADRRSRMI